MKASKALPDRTDEDLMDAIAKGDHESFQILAQRYMKLLYSVAFRLFPQKPDAEDIVQEALLRIWSKAHLWKPGTGAAVSTWLYRLTYNICIDHKRRSKQSMTALDENITDGRRRADKKLQDKQTGALVAKALQGLPERQRAAFVLCHYQGLSNQEAATVTGTSVKAIEALLVRARQALRAELQKHKGVL